MAETNWFLRPATPQNTSVALFEEHLQIRDAKNVEHPKQWNIGPKESSQKVPIDHGMAKFSKRLHTDIPQPVPGPWRIHHVEAGCNP